MITRQRNILSVAAIVVVTTISAFAQTTAWNIDPAHSTAQFTVERPTEIAGLLDGAAKAGLEVVDVSLHRPNLESVFLHLTGRELRD